MINYHWEIQGKLQDGQNKWKCPAMLISTLFELCKIISLLCCNPGSKHSRLLLKTSRRSVGSFLLPRVSCFNRQQKQRKRANFYKKKKKKKKKKERIQENWLFWAIAIEKISRSLALCTLSRWFSPWKQKKWLNLTRFDLESGKSTRFNQYFIRVLQKASD